ncbi:MAG: serine hydrolase [Patescibacteria group bacterium]
MPSKKIIILLIIGAISLVIIGYFTGTTTNKLKTNQIKLEKHQPGYDFISPLLECGYSTTETFGNKLLQKKIETIIETNKERKNITLVSVYVHDLIRGSWLGINEKETFSPSSLLKVPLMMTYLKQAETDPSIMQRKTKIDGDIEKILNQSFTPLKSVETNKEYTTEELINYMISYSDNKAANALLQGIDPEVLNKIYTDMNIAIPSIDRPENYMPVTDYASFFEVLYNASYLNREMSEKALKILASPGFQKGLTAGLPINIKVSHKFGERKIDNLNQLHDCGIIYKTNHPYLLCIMTRGDDFIKMAETIKEISREVYNNIE